MLKLFAAVSVIGCILAGGLWAQGESASARLSGTVLDPNSASVPSAKVTLSNSQTGFSRTTTIDRWFNTAAFEQPAPFTFGNAPRTMPNLRAPGLRNLDATLQKNFPIGEGRRIQIRGEFYNLTNHANFYAPNTKLGNPNFGVITGSLPGRSVQLGARVDW